MLAYKEKLKFLWLYFDYKFYWIGKQKRSNLKTVRLDEGFAGFVARDGSFAVHQVPVGTYVLNVVGSKLTYPPIRVDVARSGTLWATEFSIEILF